MHPSNRFRFLLSAVAVSTFLAVAAAGQPHRSEADAPFVIGGETSYKGRDLMQIAQAVRSRSDAMLAAMARLDPVEINGFYGDATSYVGLGKIGDWQAIVAGTASRYATRKSMRCHWLDPFRIDVISRTVAVVTATFTCNTVDTSGATHHTDITRLEVLRRLSKGWTIIAFNEAPAPSAAR